MPHRLVARGEADSFIGGDGSGGGGCGGGGGGGSSGVVEALLDLRRQGRLPLGSLPLHALAATAVGGSALAEEAEVGALCAP